MYKRQGLGRSDEEIAVYDGVVARFGDDTEPAVRERVAGLSLIHISEPTRPY